jgi:hypothetical protein
MIFINLGRKVTIDTSLLTADRITEVTCLFELK